MKSGFRACVSDVDAGNTPKFAFKSHSVIINVVKKPPIASTSGNSQASEEPKKQEETEETNAKGTALQSLLLSYESDESD
ncbi:hypothetical protein GIB67_033555 [Kingdonia uniflora]|uniref:Uncharacterized protein n=1 Tax=Kingdonia uniflora TaxID=39325 RepID=A0A7J7L683_9MAGN|nr:hypothetical protein GIB67_033555 [Kingdonia uniflora]